MLSSRASTLNEYLPLKQGLRHTRTRSLSSLTGLNEYLPLKQGLRQSVFSSTMFLAFSQ